MNFIKNLSNLTGWSTDRKIIVIESDDWGSIRLRSKKDFDALVRVGCNLENSPYTLYDCLESNQDLINLFDVLGKFKDSSGRHPVFTPMCIMANPDFDKIRLGNFNKYYYESFIDTCYRYPNSDNVPKLWIEGVNNRLFVPGLHGREHLNVNRWMSLLKVKNPGVIKFFEHQSIGVSSFKGIQIPEYLGAFYTQNISEFDELNFIIKEAAEIFKSVLGYSAKHFIAPNKESVRELDGSLNSVGVKFLTMAKIRRFPKGNNRFGTELIWLGKKNKFNQKYLTRNAWFEPSHRNIDFVDRGMKEIENAFKWKKPAVFSSHRVNYVGSIQNKNSYHGLYELKRFLSSVLKKWPEVEFLTSTELGDLISQNNNS